MPPDSSFLVLAALGEDRPGLVAQVTQYVTERGGNVEDSRMVALGGIFGLMLMVAAPPAEAARIVEDIEELSRATGMRTLVQRASHEAERGAHTRGERLLRVTARGFDREGLLLEIADVMRSAGGNIVELETTTYDEAGGAVQFQLDMTVTVATSGDAERIRRRLADLAAHERIYVEVKLAEPTRPLAAGAPG